MRPLFLHFFETLGQELGLFWQLFFSSCFCLWISTSVFSWATYGGLRAGAVPALARTTRALSALANGPSLSLFSVSFLSFSPHDVCSGAAAQYVCSERFSTIIFRPYRISKNLKWTYPKRFTDWPKKLVIVDIDNTLKSSILKFVCALSFPFSVALFLVLFTPI